MSVPEMVIEVRNATADDAAAVCNVLRRSITECCAADHRSQPEILNNWLGNKSPDLIANWIGLPSNHTVVAVRDGAIAGVALISQAGKLSLCYVLPEQLHQGIGKAMLTAVEAQARSWNISVLRLHSTATARDFFARNGYVSAGKEKSCYGVECDFFWKKLDADPQEDCGARKRFCSCNAP